MKTFGWNAIEILVQDPDALAAKFAQPGAPFEIIGPPRPLGPNSPIRAMQVIGPAQETLYLTRVPDDFRGGPAQTFVDRPFIMIVGGPDQQAIRNFYADVFKLDTTEPVKTRMTVLNKAHGLDIETLHPYSIATFSEKYAVEIDGYPPTAIEREVRAGELPAAISMVTVALQSLDSLKTPFLAPPRKLAEKPYAGRRVAVTKGAAGELYELVETN
jgi:hypothetical protein